MIRFLKKSIIREYTFVFGLLLSACIVLISVFNLLTLGPAYMYNKQKVLLSCYRDIDSAASAGDISSDEFDRSLGEISAINNIEVLIIDADKQILKSTGKDSTMMTRRLLDFVFGGAENVNPLYESGRIKIQRTTDPRMKIEYLELWGSMENGNFILMRTPVQSMKEAAVLANTMFIRFGIIAIIAGIIFISMATKKITRPIMNLVGISEKMTRLDFSEKFVSRGNNEVDALGEHMNRLSDKLEATIEELKSANTELLRDIEKKTEIDEMRKEFLSNVSHELKTPIALIQGYAEGLKDCVNDDEESRDFYCDVITDEADRMNKLVKNLLNLNELEAGGRKVEIEHFDLMELIRNCTASMDILIKQNGISLVMPQQTSIMVWADEFKTEQVLTNYLSNAIHYASGEKTVRIGATRNGDTVRVNVFNTGEPISDEVLPNLWTKFYKADKARTREYGGSGIGLSIVKACMEAMGRDYGVENHPDGVSFWFEVDCTDSI
ncbi:MAG: HAMP domain-containing histidine kinase [Lachnospiraceae bacterium]|nr:HAMP domain-containing histidine kinase [Lachnospiraceae bacterium]